MAGAVTRQRLEQHLQRRRTARRRPDGHQALARHCRTLRRRHRSFTLVALTDQPADVGDLAQQRRRRICRVTDAQGRGIDHIQRAMAHGLEHPVDVLLAVTGDDHNSAGTVGHDPSGGLHAIHDRHEQVHEDQVRGVFGAALHRLGPIDRHPDQLMRRLERQGAAQGFDRQGHVIDDGDLQARAPPINSTTASSKASSWKLALAR